MISPTVHIYPDPPALAQAAAELFARQAQEAVAQRGAFWVCLSGGSTPQALYRLLAQPPYLAGLPWGRMVFLWGDERLVPPGDPESNFGQARALLLDPAGVTAGQALRIKGELPAAEAVADFEGQLRAQADPGEDWPVPDLVLLGLGADGHTASLFPGSDPAAGAGHPALAVTGSYQGRPAGRVTLTPEFINTARQVVFLVAGADKAAALAAALAPERDLLRRPAQRIAPPHGQVTWLVDAAAAAR